MNLEMTLEEWQKIADRKAFNYKPDVYWIPDTIGLYDSGMRVKLWQLSDYRVLSVTGGSIWLLKR